MKYLCNVSFTYRFLIYNFEVNASSFKSFLLHEKNQFLIIANSRPESLPSVSPQVFFKFTVAVVVGSDLENTSPCRCWQASSGLAEEVQIPCCPLGPFLALV